MLDRDGRTHLQSMDMGRRDQHYLVLSLLQKSPVWLLILLLPKGLKLAHEVVQSIELVHGEHKLAGAAASIIFHYCVIDPFHMDVCTLLIASVVIDEEQGVDCDECEVAVRKVI